MSSQLIEEIRRLKKEKNAVILAHNYQIPAIQELADYVGDSLGLSRQATLIKSAQLIIFAGVTFMAETAAILCPDKKVVCPTLDAECPMAAQLSPAIIQESRKQHPDALVAVYVNTTADTKAEADICYTSGNAIKVLSAVKEKEIISGPDANLTEYVQRQIPTKRFYPIPEHGGCYVHRRISAAQVKQAKKLHPKAKILVHPESSAEVRALADSICSTEGMLKFSKENAAQEYIIVTEIGMVDRLQREIPEKKFFSVSLDTICCQMKKITLYNLYQSLKDEHPIIQVAEPIASRARKAIERMLEYS